MKDIFDKTPLSGERARLFEEYVACSLRAGKQKGDKIESDRTEKTGGRTVSNYEQTALKFVQSCWKLGDLASSQEFLERAAHDPGLRDKLQNDLNEWIQQQAKYLKDHPDLIARYVVEGEDLLALMKRIKDMVTSHPLTIEGLLNFLEACICKEHDSGEVLAMSAVVNRLEVDAITSEVIADNLRFVQSIALTRKPLECTQDNIRLLIGQCVDDNIQEPFLQFLRAHHEQIEGDENFCKALFDDPGYVIRILPALLNDSDIKVARFMVQGFLKAPNSSFEELMAYVANRYQLTLRLDEGRLERIREGEVLASIAESVSSIEKHIEIINRLLEMDIRAVFAYVEGMSELSYLHLLNYMRKLDFKFNVDPENKAIRPYLLLRSKSAYSRASGFVSHLLGFKLDLAHSVLYSCCLHGKTDTGKTMWSGRSDGEIKALLDGCEKIACLIDGSGFVVYQRMLAHLLQLDKLEAEITGYLIQKLMIYDLSMRQKKLSTKVPVHNFCEEIAEDKQLQGFDVSMLNKCIDYLDEETLLSSSERDFFAKDIQKIGVASSVAIGVSIAASSTAMMLTITGVVTGVLATALPVAGLVLLAAALLTCAIVALVHLVKKSKLINQRKQRLKSAIAQLDPKTGKVKITKGVSLSSNSMLSRHGSPDDRGCPADDNKLKK